MNEQPSPDTTVLADAMRRERRAATSASVALVALAVLATAFGSRRMGSSDAIVAMASTASFVFLALAAATAWMQARATGRESFAILAIGHASTAALVLPFAFTIPHAFSSIGHLGAGHAWLAVAWHAAFVIGVGTYALSLRGAARVSGAWRFARRFAIAASVVASIAVVLAVAFTHALPALAARGTSTALASTIDRIMLGGCLVALVALTATTSLRRKIDVWLAVALAAFAVDVFSQGLASRAFGVAWYVALACSVAWPALACIAHLRTLVLGAAVVDDDAYDIAPVARERSAAPSSAQLALGSGRPFESLLADALVANRFARQSLAVLVLDLDDFAAFDSCYGERAGDEALHAVGEAIASVCSRSTDTWSRVESDEFAVILRNSGRDDAQAAAERLREAIMRLRIEAAPNARHGVLTTSIGYAIVDPTNVDAADAYAVAMRGLDRAKNIGRNRIVAYERPRPLVPVAI
ncbi:MAG: hypothetical protein NVSMB59_15470 [Vulcanimicrobiaceae bacterium]